MRKPSTVRTGVFALYILLVGVSFLTEFVPGKEIGLNFGVFSLTMLKILPFAFILISLFEVWVPGETVEKHLGEGSGMRGYAGAILLAGMTVGGLYVAFPVAYSLYEKRAKLSVIFTYIGAAAICRIPMTVFEASFMGLKFSVIRLMVSLPLVIVTSILLGNYLQERGFEIRDQEK